MLTAEHRPAGLAALSGHAVRDRLVRRPARRPGPQPHPQPLCLHAVPGRLLHRLDLLRQRRARLAPGAGLPAGLSRPHPGGPAVRLPGPARCCASPRRRASPRSPTSSPPATARAPCWPGLVTVVAVVSAIPYIALQLKAVAASVTALIGGHRGDARRRRRHGPARACC